MQIHRKHLQHLLFINMISVGGVPLRYMGAIEEHEKIRDGTLDLQLISAGVFYDDPFT